jgi:DNA-directed RNA polymerase subunit beta'
VTGPGNRPLKSLSDMLKGKQGRFRQNLLGKRVDYSGRSVIVVGPELKLHQCGLPKVMALELFKPFVIKSLVDLDHAPNIKSAKRMVDRSEFVVWDVLEEVITDHPVMLNRAPTLHRLGIQAFEPVLVEGKAIRIHQLVCTAFNADFDGDHMAVHLPLSAEADAEARLLMLSSNHVTSPAHGRPLATPTQDMVMGTYYLTAQREGVMGEGRVFADADDALRAYDHHTVDLQAGVTVRLRYDTVVRTALDVHEERKAGDRLETTIGRLTFNRSLPDDYPFINHEVDRKAVSSIVEECSNRYSSNQMENILDEIKRMGFHYATRAGVTVSVWDIVIPEEKAGLIAGAEDQVLKIQQQYQDGLITREERHNQIVKVWTKTTDDVGEAMAANFDRFNPVYMMANSGARGNIKQIRQLAGMRGLMANPKGEILDRPIKANFREGLSVLEYFISTHGARKGLADTALRTADSGYLTRRLVDVAQDVIIRDDDCGTTESVSFPIEVNDPRRPGDVDHNLVGRTVMLDVKKPGGRKVLKAAGEIIESDKELAELLEAGIENLHVRTVMTCLATRGVCRLCYGWDLATSRSVDIGTAVGIIAAQSIGEPGTQLTMRTFHTGGVAGEDITHGLPRVTELFEARKPKGQAVLAEVAGKVTIEEDEKALNITVSGNGEAETYTVSRRHRLRPGITDGETVEIGTQLTEGSVNPHDLLRLRGHKEVLTYIVRQVQEVYNSQGVDINDKHIEVIVRQMMRRVTVTDAGDTDFLPGQLIERFAFEQGNERVLEEGGEPAQASNSLLGITKASLATESYLSAASFQETTRVLTDAAIAGKEDNLQGLKENVIIGKLIPAATGMKRYRDFDLTFKGRKAVMTSADETRGTLPDFAPEDLKELEAMLPAPEISLDGDALTEEAIAAFAHLDADVGALITGKAPVQSSKEAEEESAEDRCAAVKADGERCRNRAIEGTRYCRVHEKNAATDGMCQAVLAVGRPCGNKAREDSTYCGVHASLDS